MTPPKIRRQDPWRPDPLPFVGHIRDDVVALDNGGRMICWQLGGIAFETAETTDLNTAHERLNTLWRNIASPRLSLWHHLISRPDTGSPDGRFQSGFARGLDARYRDRLAGRTLFANDLYLSLIHRPELDPAARALAKIRRPRPPTAAEDRAAIARLDETAGVVEQFLAAYGPRRLGLAERDGLMFSEPAEMLYQVAYGERLAIPLVDGHLGASVLLNRQIFGHETIELRGPGASRFAGILSIKEYPASTRPGMWDGLAWSSPSRLVMSQSFVWSSTASPSPSAASPASRTRCAARRTRPSALTEEMTDAQDELMRGAWAMGEHSFVGGGLRPRPGRLARRPALRHSAARAGHLGLCSDGAGGHRPGKRSTGHSSPATAPPAPAPPRSPPRISRPSPRCTTSPPAGRTATTGVPSSRFSPPRRTRRCI